MRNRLLIALLLATLLMLPCASYGKINGTFTLPDSVLLFETDSPGAPYDELLVVSTMGTVVVQAPSSFWGQLDTMALAPGADRIVWGLSLHDDFEKKSFKSVLGMYSLLDKSWKTYGDFCANGVWLGGLLAGRNKDCICIAVWDHFVRQSVL